MKSLSYLKQIVILVAWVFVVIALFTFIKDKQVAGATAGVGFILIPTWFLFSEVKRTHWNLFQVISLLAFLLLSGLPIFLLRITNWGVDFKDLSLFGLSANFLHQSSNVLYLVMVVTTCFCYYFERRMKKNK
ncbi:MAG: hypothetical protein ACXVAX_03360 [Pseudobdellovibrio sp.]